MQHVTIVFGERHRVIALPATYEDLIKEARKAFPYMSSVYSICVLFKAEHMPSNNTHWVELDPSAYAAIPHKALLYFNVQHPITKEYILPLPDHHPNVLSKLQKGADGIGRSAIYSPENDNTIPENVGDQVSHRDSCSQPCVYEESNAFVAEAERPDGDACGSGWGVASERFRRSAKLIPNLKECKEAIGLVVEESNGYPDEQNANYKKILTTSNDQRTNTQDAVGDYRHHVDFGVVKCAYGCNCQDCEKEIPEEHTKPSRKTPDPLVVSGELLGTVRQTARATPAASSSASQQWGGHVGSASHSQSWNAHDAWGRGTGAQSLQHSTAQRNIASRAQFGGMTNVVDNVVGEHNRRDNPHSVWVGSGTWDTPAVPGFPPGPHSIERGYHEKNITGSSPNTYGGCHNMGGTGDTYADTQNQMGSDIAPGDQHAYNSAFPPHYPSSQGYQNHQDQIMPASTWSPQRVSSEDHEVQGSNMAGSPAAPPQRPLTIPAPARFATGSPVQAGSKTRMSASWAAKGRRMTAADNWGAPQGQLDAYNMAAYHQNRTQPQEQQYPQQMAQPAHGDQEHGGQGYGDQSYAGPVWGSPARRGLPGHHASTNYTAANYAPAWRCPAYGPTTYVVADGAGENNAVEDDFAEEGGAEEGGTADGSTADCKIGPRGGGSNTDFWHAPNQVTTSTNQPVAKEWRQPVYNKEANDIHGTQKDERGGDDVAWGSSRPKGTTTGEMTTGFPQACNDSRTHCHSRRCCVHDIRKEDGGSRRGRGWMP